MPIIDGVMFDSVTPSINIKIPSPSSIKGIIGVNNPMIKIIGEGDPIQSLFPLLKKS